MVALLGGIVVQVDADEAGGETAEVLGVVEKAKRRLGGGVAEIVPVAESGSGQTRKQPVPSVVGRNFPWIFATLESELQAEGLGALAQAKKNFLHEGPAGLESFFPRLEGKDFLADEGAGADLTGGEEGFEGRDEVVGASGAEVENDKASADGGGGVEGSEGVSFGEAAGGRTGIGKFVGVGVGPEEFHRHGAKVVQNINFWGLRRFVFGENSGPKMEAGVVA